MKRNCKLKVKCYYTYYIPSSTKRKKNRCCGIREDYIIVAALPIQF